MSPTQWGKGIININIIDSYIIFGTLMGACIWNIITWYFGCRPSSSHALIGGLIGAALVKQDQARWYLQEFPKRLYLFWFHRSPFDPRQGYRQCRLFFYSAEAPRIKSTIYSAKDSYYPPLLQYGHWR